MTTPRPHTPEGQPLLKMKQLMAATGLPKSTLLLYVNKGLLPPPVKTSPNMAWYHPDCVSRIQFLRRIQADHRLPLAAIKGLLREWDQGRDIAPLLELQSQVFGSDTEPMDEARFCRRAEITPEFLAQLSALELILPLEPGRYDAQDVEVARMLKQSVDGGMELGEMEFYPRLAAQIVDRELALREKYTQALPHDANAALTLEMTRMARGLRAYVIDRTLQKRLIQYKGLKPE